MGLSSLDDSSGMLFVYEHPEPQKFRMKNTPIPLDIIFAEENGCICQHRRISNPMSDWRYWSAGPVKYVIEVRAGFAKRFHIDTDTCIHWQYIYQKPKNTITTLAGK